MGIKQNAKIKMKNDNGKLKIEKSSGKAALLKLLSHPPKRFLLRSRKSAVKLIRDERKRSIEARLQ